MKFSEYKALKSSPKRVVIFGGPKTGKTELVGRLAEKYKLIYFDLENSTDTLLKLPDEWLERIELVKLPDSKVFPVALPTMLKVITGAPVNICEAHGKIDCPLCKKSSPESFTRVALSELDSDTIVVIDSLTQLAVSAMSHITKDKDDDYKYDWDDYRKQGTLMDKFLSQVQTSSFNIACITHEAEVELDDGSSKLVPIAGTANFSRNTARYFGEVIYCRVKNSKHSFGSSTTYTTNVLTGSRSDFLIESLDAPSLIPIFSGEVQTKKEPDTANKLSGVKSLLNRHK
jgi:hypothetical protein